MPKYFVALNRPEVDAATPEEAMTKCLSEPVGPNDTFYVKEVLPEASMHYVAGGVATLGGGFLNPDATATGTTMRRKE